METIDGRCDVGHSRDKLVDSQTNGRRLNVNNGGRKREKEREWKWCANLPLHVERSRKKGKECEWENPFSREPRRRRARVEIPFAGCLMRQSRGVIKCQTNAERESRSERLPHGTARHGRYTAKRWYNAGTSYYIV